MKKFVSMGFITLVSIGLVACSSNGPKPTKESEEKVETAQESTDAKSANNEVLKSLENEFNKDGKTVDVTLDKDVVDSESDKPHEVIRIEVTDQDTRKKLAEADEAIRNEDASEEQSMYINSIRQIISDEAKKLANNNDAITFAYQDDNNDSMLIAYSTKTKDIIQPTF
ncbi:hypothetical protein [Vagococcus sp.]|uniref:hypothetical protein n=1 Tax=Vagococcus sp. TaxID=1933889 RepID=UPI003F9610FF